MKNTLLALVLLTFFAPGCTVYQINSQDSTVDFYPPKKSVDEVVYLETVDRPVTEIGIVTVTTERRQSQEDALPKLKQEAAILGGDAITDIKSDASSSWWKNPKIQKLLGNAYIRTNYTAKVLVWKQ